ncbi:MULTISPECIES: C40 family peptidase [Bacillales]|uniref:C40 family peptidase n=1 Tax=Bacillales TaxID=1385 RepID=UPI00080816AF|nr:C40 family peptidase [Bacillus sp. FJAT-27264]OBZ15307.1 hydrolase [Bacillus sp. FJAT-27264]
MNRQNFKKIIVTATLGLALAIGIGTNSASADSKMDSVITKTLGTSYKTGGTSTAGFDCSGFTTYVYKSIGISLPRTSQSQYSAGTSISRSQMRPGDLVFFNTLGNGVSHVGIFVGNGKFAQSSSSRGVIISSLSEKYWADRYIGAKRIMSTTAYKAVAYD